MLFVTVEHTGTHYAVNNILRGNQFPIEELYRAGDGDRVFAHLYDKHMPMILELAEAVDVVTTSRPYADVEASWIRRGKDLNELKRQWANYERILEFKPNVIVLGTRK